MGRAAQENAFRAALGGQRVLPAVRTAEQVAAVLPLPARIVYLLDGRLSTLDEQVHRLRDAGKEVMLNLDLFSGLSRDAEAVGFLARSGVAGIISTHADVLAAARASGLLSIQRTFLLDSGSITSTLKSLRRFVPDALELLPAPVAPRILPFLKDAGLDVATIGGGLVESLAEASALVEAGIDAVSSGRINLWQMG